MLCFIWVLQKWIWYCICCNGIHLPQPHGAAAGWRLGGVGLLLGHRWADTYRRVRIRAQAWRWGTRKTLALYNLGLEPERSWFSSKP
jgi:hypothetical protein